MKIAYLIDCETLGGGCEYIRRKSDERRRANDECRTFYSSYGECASGVLDVRGANEIVVNHLKALLQLLGNPFRRLEGSVTFFVHGIHLRKYDWMIGEKGREAMIGPSILRLRRFLRRTLERRLYHRCDRIVALTESDREDILRLYGKDVKVIVEPNTLEGWTPTLSDGFQSGATGVFQYVCIGRFDYQKGQDRWISKISGQGTGKGELGRNAERYLKCAEVVVSPSRWEGMPYLMMKTRALGCRILTTDCPGNRDVLEGYDKWEKLEL